MPTGSPLCIKWRDNHDVCFLITVHEDVLVQVSLRGAHHKIKPSVVLDYNMYKTGVDRSDQIRCCPVIQFKGRP
jgi:hypothetical protein